MRPAGGDKKTRTSRGGGEVEYTLLVDGGSEIHHASIGVDKKELMVSVGLVCSFAARNLLSVCFWPGASNLTMVKESTVRSSCRIGSRHR